MSVFNAILKSTKACLVSIIVYFSVFVMLSLKKIFSVGVATQCLLHTLMHDLTTIKKKIFFLKYSTALMHLLHSLLLCKIVTNFFFLTLV